MTLQQAQQILQLEGSVTLEELKENYRDLLQIWHPDKHCENERRRAKAEKHTKLLNEAYQVVLQAQFPETVPKNGQEQFAQRSQEMSSQDEAFLDVVLAACAANREQWFKKAFDLNWHLQNRSQALIKHYWKHRVKQASELFRKFGGHQWNRLEAEFKVHLKELELNGESCFDPRQWEVVSQSSGMDRGKLPSMFKVPRLFSRGNENEVWAYIMMFTVLFDYHIDSEELSDGRIHLVRR